MVETRYHEAADGEEACVTAPSSPGEPEQAYAALQSGALDEINAKLDLLLASQGIDINKEVIE